MSTASSDSAPSQDSELGAQDSEPGAQDSQPSGQDSEPGGQDSAPQEPAILELSSEIHETFESLVLVSWEQTVPGSAWVEFSFEEGDRRQTPAQELEAGTASAVLLGVPFNTVVDFEVVVSWEGGELRSEPEDARTGVAPGDLWEPEYLSGSEADWSPELQYFLASGTNWSNQNWIAIFDRQGRPVWAWELPSGRLSLMPRMSPDAGWILLDSNSYWGSFDGGASSQIIRTRIDGSGWEPIDTPGLYHAYTEHPDGTLAWSGYEGDHSVLYERAPDGEIRSIWRCEDFAEATGERSYCGTNTVWWDAETDRYLVSIFSYETVVEVDRQTGATLRHFGHSSGGWDFSPPTSQFHWQHGVHYLESGNLLVSSLSSGSSQECVVREYRMDESTETLELVWSAGEGEGLRSWNMGEAHRLENGNSLHNLGDGGRLRELRPDGTVVWDLDWGEGYGLGRTTPITDLYALLP